MAITFSSAIQIFVLLCSIIYVVKCEESNVCSDKFTPIDGDHGYLTIEPNTTSCGYLIGNGRLFFAINTAGLKLRVNDNLQIGSKVYNAPLQNGFIVSGVTNSTKITFNLQAGSEAMVIEFHQSNVSSLPLNGDLVQNIAIIPNEMTNLDMTFSITTPEYVHLEVIGKARIMDAKLNHKLLEKGSGLVQLAYLNDTIRVKTSTALKNCSSIVVDSNESVHDIAFSDSYKCVNLFTHTITTAHYEAKFDSDSTVVIDDGSSYTPRRTVSRSDGLVTFKGNNLAVIYNGGRQSGNSTVQSKLSVQAKLSGGVVEKPGPLTFSSGSGQVRFVLVPGPQEFATIELSKWPQGVDMTVSSGKKVVAEFKSVLKMPPIVALNERGAQMSLNISAKDFKSLDKIISYKNVTSPHCHGITSSGLSIKGAQTNPCYWVMSPPEMPESFALDFNYNDLAPNGCLAIHSLFLEAPLYSKCGLEISEILPPFVLKGAFINVTVPSQGSQLDATLSNAHLQATNLLDPSDNVTIVSQGYPSFYALSNDNQAYSLNGTAKQYLMTVYDVDIRAGEKLLVNKVEVSEQSKLRLGDIIVRNTVTAIEVVRSSASKKSNSISDVSHRRGYNMTASRFDQIIEADTTKQEITTSSSSKSVLIKISSPSQKATAFGKRVEYNVTIAASEHKFYYGVHDSRSINSLSLANLSGTTTSDSLIIVYRLFDQGNATLPEMKVQYKFIDCHPDNDVICDDFTRCVPNEMLCKGNGYCTDLSDLKISCNSTGTIPVPRIIEQGLGGMAVFFLCVFMLIVGAVGALYGPDLYKTLENRFRSGRYSTFTSVE